MSFSLYLIKHLIAVTHDLIEHVLYQGMESKLKVHVESTFSLVGAYWREWESCLAYENAVSLK